VTARRYLAFLDYLEIRGDRDRQLPILALRYGVATSTIRAWAGAAYWRDRAAALDAETDAARVQARQIELAEQSDDLRRNLNVAEEHKGLLRRLRELLALAAAKHLSEESGLEAPVMSLKELTTLARVVLPLERLYSDRAPGEGPADLSGVSDADLETLEKILGAK
jgi:hypothetical protein